MNIDPYFVIELANNQFNVYVYVYESKKERERSSQHRNKLANQPASQLVIFFHISLNFKNVDVKCVLFLSYEHIELNDA